MARCLLLAAALGACRADEGRPGDGRHLVDCADWGDDCTASRCCRRPGMQCYVKNEWYSACAEDCAPGSTQDGGEWTCEELGGRTPKEGSKKAAETTETPSSGSKAAETTTAAAPSPAPTSPATTAPSPAPTSAPAPTTAATAGVPLAVLPPAPTSAPTAAPLPAPTTPATAAPSAAPTSAPTAAPSAAPTAAPSPAPTAVATTMTAASADGGAAPPPAATTSTAAAAAANGTARAAGCDACTPGVRTVPDVVIPFWEHDLCKLGYTVKSIARHDPNRVLGTVILMWVSQQPIANFQDAIDKLKDSLDGSHKMKLVDFSPQMNQDHVGAWLAQQVLKLKAAALVESYFYVVLDAKNTLIRDLEPDAFFTPCNQGKIYGEFEPDQIPQPHAEWYHASAAALGVQPPGSSGGGEQRWPTSITPMVIHRSTALDLLDFIHEDRSADSLCGGPLCEMLGARSKDGRGATEFTLFVLFARTRPQIGCRLTVVETAKEAPMALSLWRGAEQMQMEVNLESCKSVASGEVKPLMFGAQTAALEALTAEQYEVARGHIVDVYTAAGLHDGKKTSADALMRCVAGDVEGVAGPIEDGGDEQPGVQGEASRPGSFCCSDARDSADACGTCWPGGTMYSDTLCGTSEGHCSSCKGTWCGGREAEEEPPSEGDAQQLKVRTSCEEFKCEGWEESSPCACTASCEQVCDDELLEIRMAKKFSASGPLRASSEEGRLGLPLVLLAALAAAVLLHVGARRARRRARAGEREALVAPEGPTCPA